MTDSVVNTDLNQKPAGAQPAAWRNDPGLSEKWKKRFDFYERHGVPDTKNKAKHKDHAAALQALPFRERALVSMNFYAFFFTFIYYGLFLKMWRQAVILLGAILGIGIVGGMFDIPDSILQGVGWGIGFYAAFRANGLYYLKRTQGDIGWKF